MRTADTITDAEIRAFGCTVELYSMEHALVAEALDGNGREACRDRGYAITPHQRETARARIAEILDARDLEIDRAAATVADWQLIELHQEMQRYVTSDDAMEREIAHDAMYNAMAAYRRNLDQSDGRGTWNKWRARCAQILEMRAAAKRQARCATLGRCTRAPLDPQCIHCGGKLPW